MEEGELDIEEEMPEAHPKISKRWLWTIGVLFLLVVGGSTGYLLTLIEKHPG